MTRFRKLTALWAAILLLCTAMPVEAVEQRASQEYTDEQGIVYRIENGEATLVRGLEARGAIELPAEVQGCPLTTIGESAFYEQYATETDALVTDISIPATVVRIESAGLRCANLRTITFRDAQSSDGKQKLSQKTAKEPGIGSYAFCETQIESIAIPGRFRVLGSRIFDRCEKLTNVTLEEGIEVIEEQQYTMQNVREIVFPDSVTSWGSPQLLTFTGTGFESVTLPPSMKVVPELLFLGCEKLKTVIWPSDLAKVGQGAFAETAIAEVKLPDSVKEIGDRAFAEAKVSDICWPASLETIGQGAFADNSFSHIDIPEGVKEIGSYAFSGSHAQEVSVPASVEVFGGLVFGDAWQDTPLKKVNYAGTAAQWRDLSNRDPYYSGVTVVCSDETLAADWRGQSESDWLHWQTSRAAECGWYNSISAVCRQGSLDLTLTAEAPQGGPRAKVWDFSPEQNTMSELQTVHLEEGEKVIWNPWIENMEEMGEITLKLTGTHTTKDGQKSDIAHEWMDLWTTPKSSPIEVSLSNSRPQAGEQVSVHVRVKAGAVEYGQLFSRHAVTEPGKNGVLLLDPVDNAWPMDTFLQKDNVLFNYVGEQEWDGTLIVWGDPGDEITLGYDGWYVYPDKSSCPIHVPEVAKLTIAATDPMEGTDQNDGTNGLIIRGPDKGTVHDRMDFRPFVGKNHTFTDVSWSVSPAGILIGHLDTRPTDDWMYYSPQSAGEFVFSVRGTLDGKEVTAAKQVRITDPETENIAANLVLEGPDTEKPGEPVTYTLRGAPGDAWITWYLDSSGTPFEDGHHLTEVTFTPAADGLHTVSVQCQWDGRSQAVSKHLLVTDQTEPLEAAIDGPDTAVPGDFVVLTVSSNQPRQGEQITWKANPPSALLELSDEDHAARFLIPDADVLEVEATVVTVAGQSVTAPHKILIDRSSKAPLSLELNGPRTAKVGAAVTVRALPNTADRLDGINWKIEPACAYTLSEDKLSLTFIPDHTGSFEIAVNATHGEEEPARALHIVNVTEEQGSPPEETKPTVVLRGPERVRQGEAFSLIAAITPQTAGAKVLWSINPGTEPYVISEDGKQVTITPQSGQNITVYAFVTIEGEDGELGLATNIEVIPSEAEASGAPSDITASPAASLPPGETKPSEPEQSREPQPSAEPTAAESGTPVISAAPTQPSTSAEPTSVESQMRPSASATARPTESAVAAEPTSVESQARPSATATARPTESAAAAEPTSVESQAQPSASATARPTESGASAAPTPVGSQVRPSASASVRPVMPAPAFTPSWPVQVPAITPNGSSGSGNAGAAASLGPSVEASASSAPSAGLSDMLSPDSAGNLSVSGQGEDRYLLGLTAAHEPLRANELTSTVNVPEGCVLRLTSADGRDLEEDGRIATGLILSLVHPEKGVLDQAVVVVRGDVLGTGRLDIAQLVGVAQAIKGERELEGPYLQAAKWTDGSRVTIADLVRQAQALRTAES